jgi:hypothetical protein
MMEATLPHLVQHVALAQHATPARVPAATTRGGGCARVPVAVVRRRPDCDELLVEHELVTFHRELVRSRHHLHVIAMAVLRANIRAKHVTSAARIDPPACRRTRMFRIEAGPRRHG